MKIRKKFQLVTVWGTLMGSGLLVSCGSQITRSEFAAGTTAGQAVESVQQARNDAYTAQADVLGHDDFQKGLNWDQKAQKKLKEGEKATEVLEDAGLAISYYKRATHSANEKRGKVEAILEARHAAVQKGAHNYADTHKALNQVDAAVRSKTDNFTESLSPENFAAFQKRYLELEVATVQAVELDQARTILVKAQDDGASRRAPQTLNQAKQDIATAENLIERGPRDRSVYEASVDQALKSALLLSDVMNAIRDNGRDTSETVALKLVQQNRKLGNLDSRVQELRQNLDQAESSVSSLNQTVAQQNQNLESAKAQISFQQALEQARKEFDADEAEAYQQGDKLIFRLKKVNFAVGRADIPGSSVDLLAKVATIAKGLPTSKVTVEGHTDSTGSKAKNLELSQARAESVAKYLEGNGVNTQIEANGYGPNKPIAPNESKEGRALNRRVDVVFETI